MKNRKIYTPKHLKASYLPKIEVRKDYNEPLQKKYKVKSIFIGLFVVAAYVSIIDFNQEKGK